ncbi:MAG: branched-chain amino acid ABC transporter permease [Comamonas sp.]|nr:branched-chain amino acid ABC transporter permease [Comamonas sp.]
MSKSQVIALGHRSAVRARMDGGAWRLLAGSALVLVAGVAMSWLVGSQLMLGLMTRATILAIVATAIGFLIRQNGLTSFGHAAFFGMAVYFMALNGKYGWMPAELAALLAIVLPALFAFFAGLIIVQLPPLSFSMVMLALAQSLYQLMLRWRELANGDDGLSVRLPQTLFGLDIEVFQAPQSMFIVSWIALVLVLVTITWIGRSRFGVLTIAIRENEERARYLGYHTLIPRVLVLSLSAAIAGLAGVLSAFYDGFASPDALHWSLSGETLIMAIIGGSNALWGPALGAVIFFFIKDTVGNMTEHWPAIIGLLLVTVTVVLPRGVSDLLLRLSSLRSWGKS